MKLGIDIPIRTPSLNEVLEWKHNPKLRNWRYAAYQTEISNFLVFYSRSLKRIHEQAPRKMRVKFIRYSAGTLDDQNLRGGFKPLCDVLVSLGVLHDDSPTWLDDQYEQVKSKRGDHRTRIELEVAPCR